MIRSTMAGTVVEVRVAPGDSVAQGQEVVVLDSMKMQLPIAAPATVAIAGFSAAVVVFVWPRALSRATLLVPTISVSGLDRCSTC